MDLQDILGAGARFLMPEQVAEQDNAADEERTRQQRIARGQAARLPGVASGAYGPTQFMGFANSAMAPGMTAHANAAGQINDAISQEMQSRVAQAREARRMQHEKDMLNMRIQAASAQGDGGLDRGTVIRELLYGMRG
jgi:hypothetical protein